MDEKILERFFSKVNKNGKNGCWEWTASCISGGYGQFWNGKANIYAHRFSWLAHVGTIPKGNHFGTMCVLHRCDNPACVNPNHLFLGTNTDNIADKVTKCRQASGEHHGCAKLTAHEVMRIRQLYSVTGITQDKIAKIIGISRPTISAIVNDKIWINV